MMDAVVALAPAFGLTAGACAALNVSRASIYRRRAHLAQPLNMHCTRPSPQRALSVAERRAVLGLLRAPRFADQAPAEVYASLLDEGVYLCSIRTMYRVLAANQEVRERRDQLRHPVYKKPELLAQAPNQVSQRFAVLTPKARILRALINSIDAGRVVNMNWTCPATRSATAGPSPR